MRVLFVVLVLLNLLALASARGWLGTSTPQGEPERLSNQLNPGRIVLRPTDPVAAGTSQANSPLPAEAIPAADERAQAEADRPETPASTALAPADACVNYAGLTEAQAENLMQTAFAGRTDLRFERKTTSTPSAWWVRIPPSGGKEAAERRVAELRALGINDLFIVQDAGPNQFAVSLGLFKTEAKAQQHLATLQKRRVQTAGIAARSAVVHRIEVSGPATSLETISRSRPVRQSGATVSKCKP
ncbi:SPOR domain-containing protein [Aromatoleum diolicum]|uniref:SPOR domain-containing protein n=2 Tax=Aromatoleum diolicum TaxID=75796 RepID=A0ABX1Q8R5_9RHOO|nr:SPOR domain-containing protein [Aromatoleum diolicum]